MRSAVCLERSQKQVSFCLVFLWWGELSERAVPTV